MVCFGCHDDSAVSGAGCFRLVTCNESGAMMWSDIQGSLMSSCKFQRRRYVDLVICLFRIAPAASHCTNPCVSKSCGGVALQLIDMNPVFNQTVGRSHFGDVDGFMLIDWTATHSVSEPREELLMYGFQIVLLLSDFRRNVF